MADDLKRKDGEPLAAQTPLSESIRLFVDRVKRFKTVEVTDNHLVTPIFDDGMGHAMFPLSHLLLAADALDSLNALQPRLGEDTKSE